MGPADSQPRLKRRSRPRLTLTRLPPAVRQSLLNCKPLKRMKSAAGLKNPKNMPKRNRRVGLLVMTRPVVLPMPHCRKRQPAAAARLRKRYRVVRHGVVSRGVAAVSQVK